MDRAQRQRRSPRLRGYDYRTAGAYFVTVCTANMQHRFGTIRNGIMHLNDEGQIARQCWLAIPDHFPHVELDAFIIMPNHMHGIVVIVEDAKDSSVRTRHASSVPQTPSMRPKGTPAGSLGAIIGSYKSAVTREINRSNGTPGARVWHGRYHDHIIRSEADLERIRAYILYNPSMWPADRYYRAGG